MRKIASNDILEILKIGADENFKPLTTYSNLMELDQRAKWAMSIIQAWGMMATFGDIVNHDKEPPTKPVPPSELVMRVCEVVDADWSEMRHRSWILPCDSLVDEKD